MSPADAALVRRNLKQVWLGAGIWAVVFGGSAAASALSYVNSFPTAASRHQVAVTTGQDSGLAVLLGPVSAIGSVGGYTVYKCFVFLTTIGALWALFTTTRLLRGEEDAGRWQLVLAGATRPSRATAATLLAVGGVVASLFAVTTAIVLLAGRRSDVGFGVGESVVYGLSLTIAPAVFIGVGALAAQLGRTRRVATGLGLGLFAGAFVVRMVADSGPAAHWLRWLSPFGWTELMAPFSADRLLPLLPAVVSVVVLCGTAVWLAGRRDVGDGVLAAADESAPRPFGLGSVLGLAARLERPALIAWCTGATAAGFAFGLIAKVATGSVPSSVGDTLQKFGGHGRFVNQYLGVTFLFVATVVALLPASLLGAAAEDEASGRLVHVLTGSTRRATTFGGQLAIAAGGIVVAAGLAGAAAWVGTASQGIDVGFGSMIGAGLNVVPTALAALAIGAAVLAVAPRAAVRTVYAVVIASLLIDVLGATINGLHSLDRVSLFHYMALAPAQDPDPTTLVISVVSSLVVAGAATIFFARRDVALG